MSLTELVRDMAVDMAREMARPYQLPERPLQPPDAGQRDLTDAELSFAAQEAVRLNPRLREMVLGAIYDEGDSPEKYL
jgi:hypothetical protein